MSAVRIEAADLQALVNWAEAGLAEYDYGDWDGYEEQHVRWSAGKAALKRAEKKLAKREI